MCGIVGIVAKDAFTSKELLARLKKLEYRGYDSYGYWNGSTIDRRTGSIVVADDAEPTTIAISHTRWATHGGVSELNAHPHRVGRVTIVHNGIIENWAALRECLPGRQFRSETDSEVIAQFLDDQLGAGVSILDAIRAFISKAEGTFATLITVDGDDAIYAAKRDSPLALGVVKDRFILASDIFAFCDVTDRAIFFENDECARVTGSAYEFFSARGAITKRVERFVWNEREASRAEHAHYMIKEIHEEPVVAERLLASLNSDQRDGFEKLVARMRAAKRIVFTAAGTAYHASLLGASMLHQCGIPAQAIIASEFENFVTVDKQTLVVAVSQSGETMDVIEALKYGKQHGATIASIVNLPYSTIERISATSLQIKAGQEVAVASTKAFTNQALLLLALAAAFNYPNHLDRIPAKLERVLTQESQLQRLASELHRHRDLYILGRRLGYPIAREIALKIKEISYIHAEGMMGGELKHGTIALIEKGTPVISLIYDDDPRMRGSTQEVKARGARAIVIGTTSAADIRVDAESEAEFMLLAATVGQLLAYHIALAKGLPIDKPRNLAKSVTVL